LSTSSLQSAQRVSLPSIQHLPSGAVSLDAAEASIELAEAAGLVLDESQRNTVRAWMGERADGSWAAFEAAHIMPRQNGKGAELQVRQLGGLFVLGEALQLHSAHEFRTANEHFLRMASLVDGCPDLKRLVARIRYANGEQGIELKNGARLKFLARSGGAGRGFAGASTVYYDEAMYLEADHIGAALPTLSTYWNPQVVYTGSAGFGSSSQLWRLRRRALSGSAGRLAYVEHTAEQVALDGDRVVSNRDTLDAGDRSLWAGANPALGLRISQEFVEAEYESMPRDQFMRERLGIWEPEPLVARARVFSDSQWSANYTEDQPDDPIAFAVDVTPDRRSASIAACSTVGELRYVTVLEHRPGAGIGWVCARVAEVARRFPEAAWVLDHGAAAGALSAEFAELGVVTVPFTSREIAQACGAFHDAVTEGRVRYPRQRALDDAVQAATVRPLGEAWAWDRRSSDGDISPLVACTFALAASRSRTPRRAPQIIDVWSS